MPPGEVGRLPAWNTAFLGRETELADVAVLLRTRRVVTFTGAGGCGKTRLAAELLRGSRGSFGEFGFVDLARLSDGAAVDDAVRDALGVADVPGSTAIEVVVRQLATREFLVVLDNCEHLLEATAELVERLWRECPAVRVLATSREPLGVDGEAAYRMPSLAVPTHGADSACASVGLFVDRAALARAPWGFAADQMDAVVEICRRLDGIPLAIELTAARCAALTPRQILDRLSESLPATPSPNRAATPRHRTLAASIEWSYRQLNAEEARVLRACSVFAAGFTLPALSAVLGASSPTVEDVLVTLVGRSLVEPAVGDPARFRLLQTIRQYLLSQLAETGEEEAVRTRHADFVLGRVSEVAAGLLTAAADESTRELDAEIDEIRAADDWLFGADRFDDLLALHGPLRLYWSRRHPAEGCTRVFRALDGANGGTTGTDLARGRAILSYLEAAFFAGAIDETLMTIAAQGVEIAERAPAGPARGELLGPLGMLELCLLDDRGLPHLVEAMSDLRAGPRSYLVMDNLCNLGFATLFAGDLGASLGHLSEAVAVAESIGHPHAVAVTPVLLGLPLFFAGSYEQAEQAFTRGRDLLQAVGDRSVSYVAEAGLARLRAARGEPDRALAELADIEAGAAENGQGWALGWALWARALIEHGQRPMAESLDLLDAAEELMAAEGGMWLWGAAVCPALRAERLVAAGDLAGARAALAAAQASAAHPLAALGAHRVRLAEARVVQAGAGSAAAAAPAHDALRKAHAAGLRLETLESLEFIAALTAQEGHAPEATRLLAAAASVRDTLGFPPTRNEAAELAAAGDAARTRQGPSEFAEAWAQGGAMNLDEAVAYAGRGRGERKRPDVGWDSLTPAERGVVALAARGLRNAEIAEALFTSTATVKTHLTRSFRKLGVTTRAELAALAARSTT